MLTKLSLPAVIGVFLLTATIAATSTTTTANATRTRTSTATVKGNATVNSISTTSILEKVTTVADVTRNGNERNGRGSSRKDARTVTLTAKEAFAIKDKAELEDVRRTETTTSLLPLQPPLNLTSTTTSTFLTPSSESTAARRRVKKHQLSISAEPPVPYSPSQALNTSTRQAIATSTQANSAKHNLQIHALQLSNVNVQNDNVVKSDNNITAQHGDTRKVIPKHIRSISGDEANIRNPMKNSASAQSPNSNDYIHFDITDDDEKLRATVQPTRGSRMETVNEVLSNLFPNGFTDIFRFSYASEEPNPANIATQEDQREDPSEQTRKPARTLIKVTAAPNATTTTTKATSKPTEKSRKPRAKAIFSIERSVSKEYRRELAPGHTEIVVEKLEKLPRRARSGSDEFSDVSNVITKDDLLRINRAAVDSPVLPSMLLEPKQENETTSAEQSKAIKQAAIIILNNDDSADMEGISAEDNLIAESQNVGQRFYQRLPVEDKPYGYKLHNQGDSESAVNIRIVHDVTPPALGSMVNQRPIYVPDVQQLMKSANGDKAAEPAMRTAVEELPSKQLDSFQERAEQSFRERNLVQEAPSRKFLRDFNPVLSVGSDTSTPRAIFHYEAHGLQPTFYVKTETEMQAPKQNKDAESQSNGKIENEAASGGASKDQKDEKELSLRLPAHQNDKEAAQLRYYREQQYLQHQQQLLQQQQQQEQQRQQQERVAQQQQAQQRQEQNRQLQQLHQQQLAQLQQQQQQQQRERKQQQRKEGKPQQQHQQQQHEQERKHQKEQQHQEQYFFQLGPTSHEQQQQQPLQNFHEQLQKEPPLQQQYALFQQHPPPHEYKQAQQQKPQQNKFELHYQQHQNDEDYEKARKQKQQEEQQKTPQVTPRDSEAAFASLNHHTYHYSTVGAQSQHRAPATPTPHSVVFVTLHTPTKQESLALESSAAVVHKSPYEYVTQAAGSLIPQAPAAAEAPKAPQTPAPPPTPAATAKRPQPGYTFVEVQKSVNIHNKLITEKDGKLVETHETIYPMPHYTPQYQRSATSAPLPPQQYQPQYQQHKYQQLQTPSQPAQSPATQSQQQKSQPEKQPAPQMQQIAQRAPKPSIEQSNSQNGAPHAYYPHQYAQHLTLVEGGVHPHDYYYVPQDYLSLSSNPINVQHIDEHEQQEEASSFTHHEQILPLQEHLEAQLGGHGAHGHQLAQQQVHYIQHNTQQTAEPQQQQPSAPHHAPEQPQHASAQASEHIDQHAVSEAPVVHSQPAAEHAHGAHEVEKHEEHAVHIPYPVHVPQYIDRPYPVHEIVETHVPIPYPVPEPVPVPVPVERYIDRPYPVEKIVEKRVPYPVEKVVEKIVEKEIPIEVEKVVEKVVNRPVPIPIRIPVGIPVPYAHQPTHEYDEHAELYGSPFHAHTNALGGWSEPPVGQADFGRSPLAQQIPPKVLQNYYARMLKKLLPKALAQRGTSPTASSAAGPTYTHTQARPKSPTPSSAKFLKSTKPLKSVTPGGSTTPQQQYSFKIGDMRYDLKPPPPPPTGPEWSKGSRYIYNTLPHDLSVADSSDSDQLTDAYSGPFGAPDEPYDEFQRWRNGHSLKRSPQFGRSLQIEYGFKPPLVPSVEINDQGIPLNADAKKDDK